jgi:EmrB/QacA subfamily drug resistance transporter
MTDFTSADPDPRRWWTLALALLAISVAVIDTTVLNVAIPTIRREFDTSLAAVEWVITGYALVFASALVIGGRLGDMFGPRRLVMVGVVVFGIGSLIASEAESVGTLLLGEALIEGIGAALLTPNTLSLIANAFGERERAVAFAAWATALSAGSIFGPVLGGYLTSYHSWRWGFRINVVIAPVVIVGLFLAARPDRAMTSRPRLDILGALLVATGAFLVVFAVSQGNTYGYGAAVGPFTVLGRQLWPADAPISIVPCAFVAGLLVTYAFVRVEVAKERHDRDPLFKMSEFRVRTFTVATIVAAFVAFSQLGTAYCLALYLQGSRGLSPVQNGVWLLPIGIAAVIGAPLGGLLTRRLDATRVLALGVAVHAVGIASVAFLLSSSLTYGYLLPGFVLLGFGSGMTMSQMNRVMLHGVPLAETGAASGMSSTTRQAGAAAGVAVNGAIFAAVAKHQGIDAALRPALSLSFVALVAAAVFALRLRPIGSEEAGGDREPIDFGAVIETDAHLGGVEISVDRRS